MTTAERLAPGSDATAVPGGGTAEGQTPRPRLQPALHELVVAVAAPTSVLSARDGDIDVHRPDAAAHGFYHEDVRLLAVARLTLGGTSPTSALGAPDGAGAARFVGLARSLGDAHASDATVRVDRRRRVAPGLLEEEITVTSTAVAELRADLVLELEADFAPIAQVKDGADGARPAAVVPGTGQWTAQWPAEPGSSDGAGPTRVV